MTPEARLDRLERITRLIVRAGVRYRRDLRDLGDKLNIIISAHIQGQERLARNEEIFVARSAKYEKRFRRNEARLDKLSEKTDRKLAELRESQTQTAGSIKELREAQAETAGMIHELRESQTQTAGMIHELGESQAQTDRSVKDLVKHLRRGPNGDPGPDS